MGNDGLSVGVRVRVSDRYFWDDDLTRQESSALGVNTVYWVWFDEPQYDADGDGPYRGGSIWESALTILKGDEN
jgi:hypothetical protein